MMPEVKIDRMVKKYHQHIKERYIKEKDIPKMPIGDQRILAYLKRTNYDKYIEFLAIYVFPKKKHAILEHDWCCQICGGNHTEERHNSEV